MNVSKTESQPAVLGIIAGSRSLPLEIAKEARRLGVVRIVAAAIEGETDPQIAKLADRVTWLKVGQLGKLISFFKSEGVGECIMAGQVAPRNLFDLRPDLRAMKLLFSVKQKHAHSLFGAIANELLGEGIRLIEATPWLGTVLAGHDFHLGPSLKNGDTEAIRHGFRIAKQIAELEIGQLVVVKDGAVLAVEAFEGTDKCLVRGGELAGPKGGAIAIKVAKAGHDMRFDIPTIGLGTAEVCSKSGISTLLVEPGKALVLDRPALDEFCRTKRVTFGVIPKSIEADQGMRPGS